MLAEQITHLVDETNILDVSEWQLITNSINAYMISESIYAACELDVFSKIERLEIPSLANIAKAIGLNEYCCSILLLCLCCSTLISKDLKTHLYQNHSAARKAFCSDKKNNFIPFVRFNHDIQQKGMSFFLKALKSGKNEGVSFLPGDAENLYDRLAQSPGMSELFHDGMAAYTHFGPKIVKFEAMASCKRLLDVGGGNGSVSRKCLTDNASLSAVVIDIADVCAVGKALSLGFQERLQFVSDDIFSSSWSFGQDAILFSHLLEIFSFEKVKFLYQKAFDALPFGGQLFVWTIISNDDETGSLQAAKSSAYFLTMASGEGKTYSKKVHIELCQSIGFTVEMIYDRSEYDHLGLALIKMK
ncbi:MAG: methyltransferase [Coxiellaceae bacterium]|nr:methyltransferase [Coxiellaceae bacterium]